MHLILLYKSEGDGLTAAPSLFLRMQRIAHIFLTEPEASGKLLEGSSVLLGYQGIQIVQRRAALDSVSQTFDSCHIS